MASIGIEIEVLLSLTREYLGEISGSSGLEEFSEWIVEYFNSNTNGNFHMHSDIDGEYDGLHESSEWSLTDDATLSLTKTSNQCMRRHLLEAVERASFNNLLLTHFFRGGRDSFPNPSIRRRKLVGRIRRALELFGNIVLC
jgi:hypothetical protein